MMEIEVGDVFKRCSPLPEYFKVVKIDNDRLQFNVYYNGRFAGITYGHKNILLDMQKLTPLEKELM